MAMVTCIKLTAIHVPPGEIIFFRSFFALPVILGWLWYAHHLHDWLKTDNLAGHIWRGLVGCSAMALSFTALGLLPLPEVTAIGYAAPLLVTVLAAMFLGEVVRMYRLVAAGLLGGLGQILLTESYRHAEVAVIAPFEYTSMLLALGIGYFAFTEIPSIPMLIGAGLVVGAGLLIIYRERQLGLERGRARPADARRLIPHRSG